MNVKNQQRLISRRWPLFLVLDSATLKLPKYMNLNVINIWRIPVYVG